MVKKINQRLDFAESYIGGVTRRVNDLLEEVKAMRERAEELDEQAEELNELAEQLYAEADEYAQKMMVALQDYITKTR